MVVKQHTQIRPEGGDVAPDPRLLSRGELALYLRSRSTVSVPWAGACCGISRAASYAAARDGSLKTIKLGRRRLLVPTCWLERQLDLAGEMDAGEGSEEPLREGE